MRVPEPGDVAALAAELLGVSTEEALDRLDLDAVRTALSLAVGVAHTADQVAVLLYELVGRQVLGQHSAALAVLTVVHFLNEDKLDLDLSGDLPMSVTKLLDGVVTGTTSVGDLSAWAQSRLTRSEETPAMFERFTDRARRVLVLAQDEARLLQHNFIGTEHILLGLVAEGEGVAAKALQELGISVDGVRAQVAQVIGPGPLGGAIEAPPFTPRAKKTLELALREALQLGHNYIGTEHMLLGLIREGEGVAAQVLVQLGADLQPTRAKVLELLSGIIGGGERPAGTPPSPSCPRCRAPFPDRLAIHATEVDSVPLTLVWCQSCGATIGTA